MPKPNIVVYLHASLDTLFERIELRGREIEKQMDPAYLSQLCIDYEHSMAKFEKSNPNIPVLRFNGDTLNFVQSKEDLDYILLQIEDIILEKGARHNEFA